MLKELIHHKQNICLPSSFFFAGIGMSHGFGNCAGLSTMRSPEELRVFTVLSKKKNYIVESVKLTFFLHFYVTFYV